MLRAVAFPIERDASSIRARLTGFWPALVLRRSSAFTGSSVVLVAAASVSLRVLGARHGLQQSCAQSAGHCSERAGAVWVLVGGFLGPVSVQPDRLAR